MVWDFLEVISFQEKGLTGAQTRSDNVQAAKDTAVWAPRSATFRGECVARDSTVDLHRCQ